MVGDTNAVRLPDLLGGGGGVSGQNPLVILAVLVGLIVLAVLVWKAIKWFRRPKGVRFRNAIADFDEVTVLMHPNPDPDAMSCAMAAQRIAETVDTDASLQYPGQIRHQENRAFRTVLGLDLDQVDSASDLAADAVVLVDHNVPRGFNGAERIDPVAVVDHHPGNGRGREFTDVRTGYGACAAIFTEYLQELGATFEEGEFVVDSDVATGLLYGIQSDTGNLTKGCTPAEFDAASFLYPGIDEDCLDRIANPEVDEGVLTTKAQAILEREVRGSFAVSNVGEVGNVDAIPQAADELLQLEGVTAVVVCGERDGMMHLSGRSRDDRVHMGETIRSVVDEIPMADGGGHARMGGGQVSIEHMLGIGPSEGLSREEFRDRLFEAMAGER